MTPSSRAAWEANLGAVEHSRAELAVYSFPEWPLQDALRRSSHINLQPSIARYEQALRLDPNNFTAHRRLGQIALSRGDYQAALDHLVAASARGNGDPATRQLLGEAYAVNGDIERAAAIWRLGEMEQGQLALRQYWYRSLGDHTRAANLEEAEQRTVRLRP